MKQALLNQSIDSDDLKKPKLKDLYITEQSLTNSFNLVFGVKCDILAKLIYIKASKCRNNCKLTIIELYQLFKPLLVSYIFNMTIE